MSEFCKAVTGNLRLRSAHGNTQAHTWLLQLSWEELAMKGDMSDPAQRAEGVSQHLETEKLIINNYFK